MAKTFQFDDFAGQAGNPNCAACEEMLTDAIDGVLSPVDQAFFDHHLTGCTACMDRMSEARRGAAWLDLLKSHRPQPSAALMERILAQTGASADSLSDVQIDLQPSVRVEELPAVLPVFPTNVLPFIPRPAPVSRFTRFTRLAMEPRLAMTAAMAFFSIALTMNLTGVRLDQIHASDLKPANLRRSYYEAKASAVRYSDNLRVVRVLESRVDDMRQANADDRNIQPSPEPKQGQRQQNQQQNQQQNRQQLQQQSAPAPKQQIPEGSSRRESPLPTGPTLLQVDHQSTPDRLRRDASSAALSFRREGGLA